MIDIGILLFMVSWIPRNHLNFIHKWGQKSMSVYMFQWFAVYGVYHFLLSSIETLSVPLKIITVLLIGFGICMILSSTIFLKGTKILLEFPKHSRRRNN